MTRLHAALLAAAIAMAGPAMAQTAAPFNPKAAEGAPAPRVMSDLGLVGPECIRYDAANDRYLISNLGERGPGNNGFISIMTPDGRISNLKFIEGGRNGATLIDPLGMAILGDTLYVADSTHLRKFDLKTGASRGDVALGSVGRPNDLSVAPDGTVYISDSSSADVPAGAIIKVTSGGAVSLFTPREDSIEKPNGVAVMPDGHVVHGGRGVNLVFRDAMGRIVREQTLATGQFDGIVPLADGSLLVASQLGRNVYHVPANGQGTPKVVASEFAVPAAIGYDTKRKRLLVPQIAMANITFVDLP
jgi:hypothetical protein